MKTMVRKKLALAVLALTALQAGMAGALGLGNLDERHDAAGDAPPKAA